VHPVTVGADRHVRVALLEESRTVDTFQVLLVNVIVAWGAGLRDTLARLVRICHGVSVVTIGAHRGFANAAGLGKSMHAVQGSLILVRVALLTSGISLEGEVTKVVGPHRGVVPRLEIAMAGGA